ncbi:MAG TPA: TIGR00730 family Rossman fold protein [Gemmatimonadaceae bacterium]|nr:TIGR00730 family Rossman fold protein [Gemmatimonadaceae bacterium]
MRLKSICVFCGSSNGASPSYVSAAKDLAQCATKKGIQLVYGGASVGLMGVLADTALAAGGRVVGVIPRALVVREIAHRGLTELHVVETMHDRKARMAELADAFVVLPGGLGTLEELFEVWTWGMLGLHAKPFGLLDVERYYRPLLQFLDHARDEGFVRAAQRERLVVDTDPERLLDALSRLVGGTARAAISPLTG